MPFPWKSPARPRSDPPRSWDSSCATSCGRTNHDNIHVRGYKEKGNINAPMELAIQNQVDRFTLAIDAIDRGPSLKLRGSHAREALMNQQIDCRHYAYEEGIDLAEIVNWKWPL
jgi:xylulose-5-phosphate/fructose-6-phosphate phosphoketolase